MKPRVSRTNAVCLYNLPGKELKHYTSGRRDHASIPAEMPYYGNSYQDGQQPYDYQYSVPPPIPQSPQSNLNYNQVRVNIPTRPPQDYSHAQAYPTNYAASPVNQYAQQGFQYPPINTAQVQNQQAFHQHQQAYGFQQNFQQPFVTSPQQYQQRHPEPQQYQFSVPQPPVQQQQVRYQPPPPPRVVVPSAPQYSSQALQTPQKPVNQPQPQPTPIRTPVVNVPTVKQESTPSRILQDSKSNLSRPSSAMKPPKQSSQPTQSVQHPSILLSLADEYLEAAQKLDSRSNDYYKLVSTGIGCLEVTLKNFKLAPLREAQVSLKYAQVLYDETNNLDEAETVLTRSIDLCARMKFFDLKYAMQLLLAKVLFRSKPRAAIRDLQIITQDIETFKHTAWEYVFRLQAVFFDLQISHSSNIHDAIHQLERIQMLAKQHRDHSVYAFTALLESFLHLKNFSVESQERAQECLARARSMQLDPDVQDHPQIIALREVIDLIWSTKANISDDDTMNSKRDSFTKALSAVVHDETKWARDELLRLRINPFSFKGVPIQEGGFFEESDGKHYIVLSWMTKSEIEAIGYLVKGVSLTSLNHHFKGRGERYLLEGYKIPSTEIPDPPKSENGYQPNKPITIKQHELVELSHLLAAHFQLEAALMFIPRGLLKKASASLLNAEDHLNQLTRSAPVLLLATMDYIRGCIHQTSGELDMAIRYYQSENLRLSPKQNQNSAQNKSVNQQNQAALQELQILAAMNIAFIIKEPTHPQNQHFQPLFDTITSHISPSSPKTMSSIYNILVTALPNSTMLQSKQLLSGVMTIAREMRDQQLTTLTLTLIQEKFFRGGVQHSQAIKSARAAAHQVKTKWGNPLWAVIASTMDVESMVLQQDSERREEILGRVEEVKKTWSLVPTQVREALQGGE